MNENIIGKRYNNLIVIEDSGKRDISGNILWKCLCDCGNFAYYNKSSLRRDIKSCGCYKKNRLTKHNGKGTRLYNIWILMKERCFNKNFPEYKNYGKRNIIVCKEWKNNFLNFYNWAIKNNYQDDLQIDRIDNDGNYEPNNCRWVNGYVQANNKRNNVIFTINGKTETLSNWCRIKNKNYSTVNSRIRRGWNVEKIFD